MDHPATVNNSPNKLASSYYRFSKEMAINVNYQIRSTLNNKLTKIIKGSIFTWNDIQKSSLASIAHHSHFPKNFRKYSFKNFVGNIELSIMYMGGQIILTKENCRLCINNLLVPLLYACPPYFPHLRRRLDQMYKHCRKSLTVPPRGIESCYCVELSQVEVLEFCLFPPTPTPTQPPLPPSYRLTSKAATTTFTNYSQVIKVAI